jgi:hypothetical protein
MELNELNLKMPKGAYNDESIKKIKEPVKEADVNERPE